MSKGLISFFRKAQTDDDASSSSNLVRVLYSPVTRPAPPTLSSRPPPRASELPLSRLLLGLDASASREAAMGTAIPLTDTLLTELPEQLEVALAVHGGGKLHTLTRFESDVNKLRDRAAAIRCEAGYTRLLDILSRALEIERLTTIVYIGDTFEESEPRARKIAAALAARKIRLIILHDTTSCAAGGAAIFAELAVLTRGCVLPFDASALPKLRELLSAVAVLAVGGTTMLAAKQETMPAARLLLQHLKG